MKQRSMSRRAFLRTSAAISVGVAGSSLLAACGPTPAADTGGSEGAAPATEVFEVRVQSPGLPQLDATTKWAVDKFNEENTNMQAVAETIPYNEIVKKTEVGFVSGTLPDCVYGHNKWYKFNAYRGIYMSVDELVDSSPPEDFEDFFAPYGLDALRFEGALYCLPDIIKPGPANALFYNKTLLDEAGVDIPTAEWNLLDVENAARAVTDLDNGIFGFECPFDSDLHRLAYFTRAFGEPSFDNKDGWPVSEDGKQFRLLEHSVSDTMEWFVSMLNDQVMPKGSDDVEGGLFDAGKLALHIGAIGLPVRYQETIGDKFEWGALVQPPGPEGRRGTCSEGNQWMINSKTENVDAAWAMLKRLTDKDTNKWGALNTTKIPGRRSTYLDAEVNERVPIYQDFVPIMDEWLEPFPMVWNLRYNEVFQIYQQEIAFVVEGERTWEEYAQTVYEKVQDVIDEDRPNQAVN